jgi:hypothetical protein
LDEQTKQSSKESNGASEAKLFSFFFGLHNVDIDARPLACAA